MSDSLTVQDVCKRYHVKPEAVLGWIHTGQLRALDIRRELSGSRPRWRILPSDLEAFEARRANHALESPKPARRETRVKEFV